MAGTMEDTDTTYVDVSNLPELKDTCDAAVERILSRPPAAAVDSAAAPSPSSAASLTPATDPNADDPSGEGSDADGASDLSQLQSPWTGSHLVTDIKLALGFASSFLLLGVSVWSYLSPLPFAQKRKPNLLAVGVYIGCAVLQQLLSWYQRDALFVARRRASQHGIIITERLTVSAVDLPSPKLLPPPAPEKKGLQDQNEKTRPVCIPPVYSLRMRYARTSNGGKTLLKQADQPLCLGHLGEWFASDGEFLEDVFEQRLRAALAKMVE